MLDMGISPRVLDWLHAEGYEATHICEVNPTASDLSIIQVARKIDAIVLTSDKDFSHLMATSGETRPSIVLFRIVPAPATRVVELLGPVLSEYTRELAQGCLISLDGRVSRVRRLPLGLF